MKKILGLSFGRNMSNTEVMVKQALLACKEAGHEIQFLNVNKLKIDDCTGCIGCVVSMIMGIDIVDTYEYYGAMAYNNVVGNQPVMDRMTELGKHVAEAVA